MRDSRATRRAERFRWKHAMLPLVLSVAALGLFAIGFLLFGSY